MRLVRAADDSVLLAARLFPLLAGWLPPSPRARGFRCFWRQKSSSCSSKGGTALVSQILIRCVVCFVHLPSTGMRTRITFYINQCSGTKSGARIFWSTPRRAMSSQHAQCSYVFNPILRTFEDKSITRNRIKFSNSSIKPWSYCWIKIILI